MARWMEFWKERLPDDSKNRTGLHACRQAWLLVRQMMVSNADEKKPPFFERRLQAGHAGKHVRDDCNLSLQRKYPGPWFP